MPFEMVSVSLVESKLSAVFLYGKSSLCHWSMSMSISDNPWGLREADCVGPDCADLVGVLTLCCGRLLSVVEGSEVTASMTCKLETLVSRGMEVLEQCSCRLLSQVEGLEGLSSFV